jgi:hypothetical protein
MTPEEEQKLRNFRLLGGGSSMELPQQQQPIASILGQAGSGGFGTNPNQFFGPGFGFRNRMAKDGVMAYRADTGERALDFEENAVRNYANMGNRSPQLNMPTITAQVPGIENITLGQAPIVSQEGIQYQTPEESQVSPEAIAGLGLGGSFYANQIAQNTAARQGFQLVGSPQTTSTAGRLIGSTPAQYTGPAPARPVSGTQMVPTGQAPAVRSVGGAPVIKPAQVTSVRTVPQGGPPALLGKPSALARGAGPLALYSLADLGVEQMTGQGISSRIGEGLGGLIGSAIYGDTSQPAFTQEELAQMQTYEQAQGLPPIQLEALERLSPQPEATFTLPSGEVRSIMPGQDVASAFGRESGRPMTFQVDGGEVTVPSAQAIQTMNLGEQAAARQAQQEFLASPAAREMSNRMLRSVMYNDPYAQASAERVARMEAKPDFNRAVSDRERRGTGEMSMASATKLTGGDRDKARAMIELQRQGRDPMTGKEVEAPFEPKEIEIGGQKYIQLAPNYIQPVPKEETPFEPRTREIGGVTYVEESPGRFKPLPSKGTATPDADTPIFVDPPEAAIEELKKNPDLAGAFDQKYGAGSASKFLNI